MKRTLLILAFSLIGCLLQAEVRLPSVISDNMVLQADKPAALWGWADPGEKITVSIAGQSASAVTPASGKWLIRLPALKANKTPQTLNISGSNNITINNVLIGEVWFCSGQSNMAMQLKGTPGDVHNHGDVDNAEEEIAKADWPTMRMFQYDHRYSIYLLDIPPTEPLQDRPGKWIVCTPETAYQFIAIGYFVAKDLIKELNVPVGIINAATGGSYIEAWTSMPSMQQSPFMKPLLEDWVKKLEGYDPVKHKVDAAVEKEKWLKIRAAALAEGKSAPKAPAVSIFKNMEVHRPAGLFNGMIAPLIPYTVRGVLWYQGERNAAGPFTHYYADQMRLFVKDWREQWGEKDLYFLWVQIARANKLSEAPVQLKGWAVYVRDGQRRALDVPNTGMAVTIDLGGETVLGHPTNKVDYAKRILTVLYHDVYGKSIEEWIGPLYRSYERKGNKIILHFDHAKGLKIARGDKLGGFAIAGENQKFYHAKATIDGDKVIVWSDDVPEPVSVRYAWLSNPYQANLANEAGLPASPFKTDDWIP